MPEPQMFTEPAAARVLGISPRTLRRWRARGAVGYSITPGRRIRYTLENLRNLERCMMVDPSLGRILS